MLFIALLSACGGQANAASKSNAAQSSKLSPASLPQGILISEIPAEAGVIISSIRYVLQDPACLDENLQIKENFIFDADCNRVIYDPAGSLAAPRQLFALDIQSGDAAQITNLVCIVLSGQVIDRTTMMANAICQDTDADGQISEKDNPNLYRLDLPSGGMDCLTCDFGLNAINNPDYSPVTQKIVFSAQIDPVFHNYLFTIDLHKQLEQLTHDETYMDFDCAWSEDGSLIAFNRLPSPWFELPAQIWMMRADGSGLQQITAGGDNPQAEVAYGSYPIGTDADADLSPDNTQIVFSRLKTGLENKPFGVWELVTIDLASGIETVLDDTYANMVPEWKEGGILFTRQIGNSDPLQVKQALYLYRAGKFTALETYPYDVFPIGAFGASWIDR